MKRNWYIIYSKPQFEKKILASCTKKKIESYFPLKRVSKESPKKGKEVYEPLFISLVFIKAEMGEIDELRKTDGVLSILYWQDTPAVVTEDEIAAIKEFTGQYDNIKVEKSVVNPQEEITNISTAVKSTEGNVYSINCKTIKVNLPSLGFTLMAEVDTDPVFGRNDFNLKTDLKSQKQPD